MKWKTDGVVRRAARFGRSFLESKRKRKKDDDSYEPSIAPEPSPTSTGEMNRSRVDAEGSEDERFWLEVVERRDAEDEAERMKKEDDRMREFEMAKRRRLTYGEMTPAEKCIGGCSNVAEEEKPRPRGG